MNCSADSQADKRFEQKGKVNHKIGEIKRKMITTLRENWMSNVEAWTKIFIKKVFKIKISSPDKIVMI